MRPLAPLLLCLALTSCVAGGAAVSTGKPPPKHVGAETSAGSGEPIVLPASFEGGLIFLRPVTEEGVSMRLMLSSTERSTLREAKAEEMLGRALDPTSTTLLMPKMAWDGFIPESRGDEGRFMIVPRADAAEPPPGVDGVAGTGFLAERTFTIDFAARSMLFRAPGEAPFGDGYERVNLLPSTRDAKGEPAPDAPPTTYAVSVSLSGVARELQFDLGARESLSEEDAAALGRAPGLSGACTLAPAVFDELAAGNRTHPSKTDAVDVSAEPLSASASPRWVEVPSVKVAGKETGPAWFTKERGELASGVAGRVSGACLAKLALTIDFRSGLAVVTQSAP